MPGMEAAKKLTTAHYCGIVVQKNPPNIIIILLLHLKFGSTFAVYCFHSPFHSLNISPSFPLYIRFKFVFQKHTCSWPLKNHPQNHLYFPQCRPRASKVYLLVILIEFRKLLYKIPKRESAKVRLGIHTSLSYFLEYFDNTLMLLSPSSFCCSCIPQRRKEWYSCSLNKDTSCLLVI